MKKIIITGASGFLGHHIVKALLKRGDTNIIAILGKPGDKSNVLPQDERLKVYPCSSLHDIEFSHVDTLIHTAFSRGEDLKGLTLSLDMTKNVIELVNKKDVDSIINISSQGIYKSLRPGETVDENGEIEPNTTYGLAKRAVENMLELCCRKRYTSIRMASLGSNAGFLNFFVESIMDGKDICVTAPHQYASIMDVSDAVSGILSVENLPLTKRDSVYNLGPGNQYSILDYAETANRIGKNNEFLPVKINVNDKGGDFAICMDCEKIKKQTCWKPLLTKEMIIQKMYEQKTKKQ